ncbi:SHOCT domain-containing protein [Alistipes sp.]|nr:SHOCT domain-containing protein [Alistipes sp.]
MDKKTFDMRYNQGVSQIGNADELAKLYELKEKGAITPEEFYEKKKLLL